MVESIFNPAAVDEIPPYAQRQPASDSKVNLLLAQAEAAYLENKLREEALREAQNNNELRKTIPNKLWGLTISWLIIVMFIIILSGIDHQAFPGVPFLKFESTVLIALITSTTASVIGLFAILLNYLYPNSQKQEAKQYKKSD
jgi:hypothetical protein